jgi:hypothetical protein
VCILELNVTVNNIKILCCTTMPLWRIYVAGNNTTYVGILVKCPIFCQLLTKFVDSRQIFVKKKTLISNFTEIGLVGAALTHADGRTDRWTDIKLIGGFRNVMSTRRCFHIYRACICLCFTARTTQCNCYRLKRRQTKPRDRWKRGDIKWSSHKVRPSTNYSVVVWC